MKIDLFTFVFQMINFFVLVFLLYFFLFRRVIKAIDAREKLIQNKVNEAAESSKKAQDEKDRLIQKQNEIESSKHQIFEKSQGEAEKEKQEYVNAAKKQVEENKKNWEKQLENQKDEFYRALKKNIVNKIFELGNKALSDLASESLQMALIEYFFKKIKEEKIEVANENIIIESALEIDLKSKEKIQDKLKQLLNQDVTIKFEINPALIAGICMKVKDKIIKWNISDYLSSLQEDINNIFQTNNI